MLIGGPNGTGWDLLRGYGIIDGLTRPHFGYQRQKGEGEDKKEIGETM